jgi:hypothetical protein
MKTAAIVAGLFVTGVAVNLYFARAGYMPLDQSIVFDGAWRLMGGQVPFRDFAAPNAFVPSIMQVPFFRVWGPTWFAYCLHASVVNGLFAIGAYAALRMCEATRVEATLFAALSTLYFYPPNGTPFMDQHAFFFSVLMMVAAIAGTVASTRAGEFVAWALVPVLFTLAYLSKQVPTAFAGVSVAVWVVLHPARMGHWIAAAACGSAVVAAVLLVVVLGAHVDSRTAFTYLVTMPMSVGAERTTGGGAVASVRLVAGTLRRLPVWLNCLSLAAPIVGLLTVPFTFRRDDRWALRAWLSASLLLMTAAFIAYTVNQIEDGEPVVMLLVGVGAVMVRRAVVAAAPDAGAARRFAFAVTAIIAALAVRDTVVFTRDVDVTRSVLDMHFNPREADAAEGHLPSDFAFLRWNATEGYSPDELTGAVRFLRDSPGNFLLIGDTSMLNALARKPSVSPALWLHPGLSMPIPGTPAFDRFESELVARLDRFRVRYLVLEEPSSIRGISLAAFPRVKAIASAHGCAERHFGNVRVIDLCPS